MNTDEIYLAWNILNKISNAEIERDFYEFIFNKFSYNNPVRFIESKVNTEEWTYYTEEELNELIRVYQYMYRSGQYEIRASRFLLDFSVVLTYQEEKGIGFFPGRDVLMVEKGIE